MKLGPLYFSWSWSVFMYRSGDYCGLFRNREGVKPGRWGFYILGFEFGNRNPDNWFGRNLKRIGLWPW